MKKKTTEIQQELLQDNMALDSMVDYFKIIELTEVNMHLLNKKARQLEQTRFLKKKNQF